MWSGSTTGLLKVRNIDRVKPFYTFCAVGTIRLGIIILLNRIRYKKDDAMLSKHMYSNLEIQWHTAPDILSFTDTMAHRYSYTVIYKYNGKQVQVQLFTYTIANGYTYTTIYRCNGTQVPVYSYLQIQWRTGTCIQLFTDIMVHRHMYTVIYRYHRKLVHIYSFQQIQRNWCNTLLYYFIDKEYYQSL